MHITRRKLILDLGRLGAGILAGGLASCGAPAKREPSRVARPPQPRARGWPHLPPAPLSTADYWSFADWIAGYFDQFWDPLRGHYEAPGAYGNTMYNGELLLIHAVAALKGHRGLSRRDERVEALAMRLCESPPWSEVPFQTRPDPQFHDPGWREFIDSVDSEMDKSIDPKVAEALMYTWRARDSLGLAKSTARLIEDRISRCARGPFFRYPSVRLNQLNWNCELYAHAATVSGADELLRRDYGEQVRRFVAGVKRPLIRGGSPNLGPGYQFHYLPNKPPNHPFNIDAAEYANTTCQFIQYYEHALRAGMSPLSHREMTLLRAWIVRILCGYWTHAGYLNWDTGRGFKRWHIGKTWAFAQQGLLAMAASPRFQTKREHGGWAKYLFDRGLILYQRFAEELGNPVLSSPILFGVHEHREGLGSSELFATRIAANAARAVALGIGEKKGTRPPPLYSFDPDTGRLAVTTPSYSTAVVPVNQGAFPYGGIELARLYDADQRVLANIGGVPLAAFGVLVRDARERPVLISQQGRPKRADTGRPPLELASSPEGAVHAIDAASSYPRQPYSGPFNLIEVIGRAESSDVRVEVTHRFYSDSIASIWRLVQQRPGRYTVDFLFPSWTDGARIYAVLRDGRRMRLLPSGLEHRAVHLQRVAQFHIAGPEAGYVVVPKSHPRGTLARLVRAGPQLSDPLPGPTLAITPIRQSGFTELKLSVRIAPAAAPKLGARAASL